MHREWSRRCSRLRSRKVLRTRSHSLPGNPWCPRCRPCLCSSCQYTALWERRRAATHTGCHAIRPGVQAVSGRQHCSSVVKAKRAVVARGDEGHVVLMATVHFHNLLVASEGEDRCSPELTRAQVQDMHGQADGHGVCWVGDPLLVGDEKIILDTFAVSPLVPHLQVCGAKGLHEPVGLAGGLRRGAYDVVTIYINIALVHVGGCGLKAITSAIPWADGLPLQVVGLAHGIARSLHHFLGLGRCPSVHEGGEHAAVVVDVVNVGPCEAGTVAVYRPGKGLWIGGDQLAVGLTLVDQPHSVGIFEVCPQPVRDACVCILCECMGR